MQRKIEFKNKRGETLRGIVHVPKNYNPNCTAIIYLHGFPGSSNSESTGAYCKAFEKLGYLAMRFDFSGTDTSDGKFEDKLMSKEVDEIKSAIDFLSKNYKFKKLVLIGLSTGAIDGALYLGKGDKRVSKAVLMGVVSHLDEAVRYDFTDRQMRDFWTKGFIVYKRPGKWVHRKKLKKAFYDEFFTLDIPKSIKKYKRPLLILHGEKDEAIPSSKDPHELYAMANKPKKLVILKGADHKLTNTRTIFKKAVKTIDSFIKGKN